MIIKIFNKSIAVFLTFIFILGLFPAVVFAQPNPAPANIKGFNNSVFESHFSKADREINPERWLFEAKLGITQAIYAWELIAESLYENPVLFNEAKSKIEKWSGDELEKRFSRWLTGRFFSAALEKSLFDFSSTIDETQKKYSWHLDDEENIIFDERTGDPLIIRPGDGRDFSGDLLMWRGEADDIVAQKSVRFDSMLTGLYTELLAYIPDELRETMNAVIRETGANISGTVKREFENIAAREERIFSSRRTRDIQSLRRKNDDEAARLFTQKLISETEEICARGIKDLTARIEAAAAGTGDLALLGREWLSLYKEQFDRGLKAWEEAEERFFIRRIEWEQESFRLYSEGEEMWLAAFNQFEDERRNWELKAKELFDSGEAMFKNISEDFEKSIAEAKHEFEINKAMRIGEGTTKVKALVDMYLICSSAAFSAMDNLQYWHEQYKSPDKINPKDPNFNAWLLQEESKNKNSLLKEVRKSYDLYVSYMEKAQDARGRILANYAELIGTGALKDILSPDASSEDFYLDEYQIALIRAKALVLYWERKTAIANAVMNYANDFSAGRMTEAEGIYAWENAKAAYNESLSVYETELKKLNAIGEDIQKQQEILQNIARQMLLEEEKLNRLNSEYSIFFNASIINRSDYYLIELNQIYEYLEKEYKSFLLSGNEAEYKEIIEYGIKWDTAELREASEIVLNMLINGLGGQLPSLAELTKNVRDGKESEVNLAVRLAAIDLFADNNGQLRAVNSNYSGADWYSNAKGINLTNEEKAALYGEKLKAQIEADYKKSFRILLEKRLELELNSLIYIQTIKPVPDDLIYIPPEFCFIDEETSVYVYEILSKLKERMELGKPYYTENDEENEVINYFLSGYSFFMDSEKYLTEYYNEYYLCSGLYDIFNEYANISSFSKREYWLDTRNSLKTLFSGYGLNQSSGFLPDIRNICESILKKPGDLILNSAEFLLEFERCFSAKPQWLENEITFWENSFIEYIAAYAFYRDIKSENLTEKLYDKQNETETKYNELYAYASSLSYISDDEAEKINETLIEINNDFAIFYFAGQIKQAFDTVTNKAAAAENDKHWRQFLTEDYISNEEIAIDTALSFKDGILKDALFNAAYHTNRLNDAFAVSLNGNIDNLDDSAGQYYDLYFERISEIYNRFGALPFLYNEIANAGKVYEANQIPPKILEAQLKQSYEELKVQEAVFNAIRIDYLREAEKFMETGLLYDDQYSLLKKAHDDSDVKRFEYEKQDAIQRWASTAYLGTDHIDIENYSSKLIKAQTVLDVLSDLYKGETRRNYDNPEYGKLYSEYKQSFGRKIKTLEAIETLKAEIIQEQVNNQNIYNEYQSSLNKLGKVNTDYLDYVSPASRAGWSIKDIITVKNGRLVFSGGNTWKLSGINEKKAAELYDFFYTSECLEGERHEISKFEESLRGLSQRMSEYFSDADKFRQWSLARDYLINCLINGNSDLSFLKNYYSGLGQMSSNGSLGSLPVKNTLFGKPVMLYSASGISGYYNTSKETFNSFWEALSEDEKADLEFYVILTLSGGSLEYYYGFSQVNTMDMYNYAYKYVNEKYNYAKSQYDAWWKSVGIGLLIPGAGIARSLLYKEMRDVNNTALRRVEPVAKRTEGQVNSWVSGLQKNFTSIKKNASAYAASCERLDILEGKKINGNIVWDDIKFSLLTTGKISETNINELKSYWEAMLSEESGILYDDVLGALNGLVDWTRSKEGKNKTALENQWLNDSKIQRINENNFQLALEGYINGNVNIQTLKTAAEKAYGKNAAAAKNHINNKYTVMQNNISMYSTVKFDFYQEFNGVGNEITALTAQILENRYNAELGAREIEWNMMLRDIKEKHDEWLDLAARILENGRTDWAASVRKMEDAYKQWQINFKNEYARVSDEWNEAYLAGLEDKEKWLEQAAIAAIQASSGAFLSLVGTEGERLSRFMDVREPFGIRNALPETNSLIAELLQSSGIANMYGAFGSINNIASYASPIVRRGMGGSYSWDASIAKTAASDFAKKSNAEIAEMESKVLAHRIRLTIDEALKNLADNINAANLNFNESMDNMFIMDGLWRKSGNTYEKDIVKGSTLLTPVIEKRATVAGYIYYKMKPVSLLTNLDDINLERLNTIAVRGLLENAYSEIEKITAEIFGIGENAIKIAKRGNTEEFREQSPGKFGAHIGYRPDVKPGKEFGESKSSMFYDTGSGELGRLLSEYIYWNVIDSKGYAELSLAPWDKRIWNDENSFFPAPSIKSVGQIAGAIAATVFTFGAGVSIGGIMLAAAISSASSITFGTLDVAFGYKSLDEAAFDMGKTFLINAAGSAISGVFGAVGSAGLTSTAVNAANSTIGKIATETAMRGLQTAATSLASNILNSVTYSSAEGFGWSNEIFSSGINGMLKSTASSMVSTFTTGTLQAINSGISVDKLAGFNSFNRRDLSKLNGFIGSLAGQGIGYAMGDDFTLNVLNLSDLTMGAYESGLLELHLGRNGTSMNIGTGGVNVSYSNLAASLRGAQVWNVNNRINSFIKKQETFDADMALRAQYGYGDNVQKSQLWDILKGDTKIIADTEGDFFAQTTMVDGQRVINLSGYKLGMNMEEQMNLAVMLGHEAYRDGIVSGDNYLETRTANRAHTEMALRMRSDGQEFHLNDNLIRDLVAYSLGDDFFNAYSDSFYDSSADYWKLMRDGTLVNDDKGWLVDENGDPKLNGKGEWIGAGGIETGLLNILFGGTHGVGYDEYSDEQVRIAQNLMIIAGMKYDERVKGDMRSRYWTGNEELPLNMNMVMQTIGSRIAAPVSERYYEQRSFRYEPKPQSAKEKFFAYIDKIGNWLNPSPKSQPVSSENALKNPAENTTKDIIDTRDKVHVTNSGDSLSFFNGFLDEIMRDKNKYIAKEKIDENGKNNLETYCTTLLRDFIENKFGKEMYTRVFGDKMESANQMFESFRNNTNLEQIKVTDYDNLRAIQDLADRGVLIIVSIKNASGHGHVAIVGNSEMVYNTIYHPSSDVPAYEGMTLSSLKNHHLTVVQAGTYTGATSILYATTGWDVYQTRKDLLDGNMIFYTVKGR